MIQWLAFKAAVKVWWPVIKWLLIIQAVLLVVFALHRWDTKRQDAAYARGETAQQAIYATAQAKANAEARAASDAATRTSEQVADFTRVSGAAQIVAIGKTTNQNKQAITDAYLKQSPTPPCTPDGRPAPLPDGVRNAIKAAQARAERAGAAPSR